ncbi:hypothetical protein PN4B1_10050 [Paenibacillus naphthalenovorans]|uniref:substrate-binding domain-containing protein n=1 Tax=Paenibacillus naphthalenovorans TaxID=162209 RepID=UPI0010B01DD6|nr:substrate-binding domain-containing protein [Paenibacillus naphthalenovorans]GCL71101.1 hypothetical protein PN4B1_10050 [Paenibacillus naphthalenovorans]
MSQGSHSTLHQELRVAALPGFMPILVKTIVELKKVAPNIQTSIIEMASQDVVNEIQNDRLDIGLIVYSGRVMNAAKGLLFEPMLPGEFVLVTGRTSPLASLRSIKPDVLLQHPMVLYHDNYLLQFKDRLMAEYGRINLLFVSNNLDALDQAMIEEHAFAIGLDFSLGQDPLG